ncbi:tail fiber protein [Clostridium phage phiCD38-2]|uniref:Tail fiber protein n=1 Tax=Clostridium phage phiCD38-2 TaxID=1032362 RepID=F6K8L9_9CAUD|nr:tail fiber protein [Clostridium phage phiCD38-2]AEF56895.1 tail fiber protein [Clostridium phage phiCD38-2]
MRDRIYTVDINTKSYQVAKYKQYDNAIEFKINLLENNIEKDLTGYTAIANFQRPDGKIVYQSCTIENSIATTIIENNITEVAGDVIVEFTFYKDDLVVTTFSLKINIEKSIDKNSITEEPKWDYISVTINQVKEVVEGIEEIKETEEARKEAEIKRVEEFNSIKETFDSKVTEVTDAKNSMISDVNTTKDTLTKEVTDTKNDLTNVVTTAKESMISEVTTVKEELEIAEGKRVEEFNSIKETFDSKVTEVTDAKNSMISDVNTTKDTLTKEVTDTKNDLTNVVTTAKESMISEVTTVKEELEIAEGKRVEEFNSIKETFDSKVTEVTDAKNSMISDVNTTKTTLIDEVNTVKAEVTTAKNTMISEVTTAKETMQTVFTDAINAIPTKEELKGVGIEIKGSLDNISALPVNPTLSDAYFVKSATIENQIDLYVWDNTNWVKVPDIKIKGENGDGLEFNWDGTRLGIRIEGQENYTYTDLKGQKGDKGDSIEFNWNGTRLGIKIEGQENYSYTELKGEQGYTPTIGENGNWWINNIDTQKPARGASLRILGKLDSIDNLPLDPTIGDCWIIGRNIYIYQTKWEDLGSLAGVDGKNLEFNWDGTQLGVRQQYELDYKYIDLKGDNIEFAWDGTRLGVRIEGQENYTYTDLKGQKGDSIEFSWDGTELGVRIEGQEDYSYTNLKGATGNKLEFNWNGSQLGIREEGQTEYIYTELRGEQGYTPAIGENGNWFINGEDTGKASKGKVTWNELLEKPKELDYIKKSTTFNSDGSITDILDSVSKTITKFNADGTIVDEKYIDNVLVSKVKTTFKGNQIEEIKEEVS